MIKLLIGGSPCTFWSIAQKSNRETEAEGLGWELFKNYLIAKEKFKPDLFLYENNKSAAQAIKDQISHELGVDLMYINSALVSAQNRQRFYAFNWSVEQPDDRPVYEVVDGEIEIKGKKFPIKLPDGLYIIRKLTPVECERLQTLPDNYTAAVSATQRYRGLGNGWTAEVIIHILTGALKDVPRDEEIVVLSMYDGIGTGRYCLEKMGFTNVTYYAYEIDGPAMKVALSNFPDIIQCGDAFDLRRDDWELGKKFGNEIATSTQENANDAEGQAENKTEKEETTDNDSQSGEYPETETPTTRSAAAPDSERGVREPSDQGGVRDLEEGEGKPTVYTDGNTGADSTDQTDDVDMIHIIEWMKQTADEMLKGMIIRDFEEALKKCGIKPDSTLIAKLKGSPLAEVSKASIGFAGYIAAAMLKNTMPEKP